MRRRTACLRIPSAVVLAILLTATARAQSDSAADVSGRWTRIGPEGGAVAALAAAPSRPETIYVGLRVSGVFRSTDGGATWEFAGSGLGRTPSVVGLAVDAALPGTVYAVTDQGLSKSKDGGGSWAQLSLGESAEHFPTTVVADPRRSGSVYVAIDGGGILASADGGRAWKRLSGPPGTVLVLVIDPVHSATLYAGTQASGVFKSTDAGAHWKAINRGFPPSLSFVSAIAIDAQNPQRLFLGTIADAPFRSVDGGEHWTQSATGLGLYPDVRALAIDPLSSSAVFAGTPQHGLFRSTDGGLTWRPAGAGLPDPYVNVLLATRRGLFVGNQTGLSASRDRALTWQASHGLAATLISSLAIDAQDPPRMYAFDGYGLFKSASRGASWTRLPLPTGSDFLAPTGPVVVHPGDPQRIELGFVASVARSDNGGRRWSDLFGVGCLDLGLIVVDPSDSDVLYVSGGFAIAACALEPGACDSFKSDHGQVSCLRDPAIDNRGVFVMAVDPAAPRHLFAGGANLYRSVDAGATWSVLSSAIRPYVLVFDPVHPGTLYAGIYSGGVARSVDGGATWQVATAGLPFNVPVLSLAIDPALPSTLYGATLSAVYRSTDSGATWAQLGTGLEEVIVWRLALDPIDPTILYAATLGGGVMRLRVGG